MKLPYPLFRHIMSCRDRYYEVALTEGTPSSAAIRSVFTDWPDSLGPLAKKKDHVSCVCWVIDDATALVFTLRRVQNATT